MAIIRDLHHRRANRIISLAACPKVTPSTRSLPQRVDSFVKNNSVLGDCVSDSDLLLVRYIEEFTSVLFLENWKSTSKPGLLRQRLVHLKLTDKSH